MDKDEHRATARPATAGDSRLPTVQPARALVAAALYVVAVAVLTGALALFVNGWTLVVIAVTLSMGMAVPFVVLGQRPDAPEATARVSFPVLGNALGGQTHGTAGEPRRPAPPVDGP